LKATVPTAPSAEHFCPGSDRLGSIAGSVTDDANGSRLAGVTVVATSLTMQGTAAVLTDDAGHYALCSLPPDSYELTFYYSDITVRRSNITVAGDRQTPVHVRANTGQVRGEVVTIAAKAPPCISDFPCHDSYLRQVELPERTFEEAVRRAGFGAPCQP
jgi:hypothetical protein